MMTVRPAQARGQVDLGWLHSRHSFSFGAYYDPAHLGFESLRVVNEDVVAPGKGFPAHSHREMEILTYVLAGELEHQDSLGNQSVIRAGDVQRMTAGTGITHREWNASQTTPVHFLQIWIRPATEGLKPSYEQAAFHPVDRKGRFCLLASPSGRQGSLKIHQHVELYGALLEDGDTLTFRQGRHFALWLQVVRGQLHCAGQRLRPGDGAAVQNEANLTFRGEGPTEFLLFSFCEPKASPIPGLRLA